MRFASLRCTPVLAVAALTTLACTGTQETVAPETAPLPAFNGRDSATFVLARSDDGSSEPVVVYDINCPGAARMQMTTRDTITIWTDGRARSASVITMLRDGVSTNESHIIAAGNWARNTMPNVYYFSAAPSIVLNLEFATASGQIWLRSEGNAAFTRLSPTTHGNCQPGARTAREAIFTYTRR